MNNEIIKIKVAEYDKKLKEHDKRLDKIEQDGVEFRVQIKNLCKKIDELTSWIKALVLAMIGTFGSTGASWGAVSSTTTTSTVLRFLDVSSRSSASMDISYMAIGRWK